MRVYFIARRYKTNSASSRTLIQLQHVLTNSYSHVQNIFVLLLTFLFCVKHNNNHYIVVSIICQIQTQMNSNRYIFSKINAIYYLTKSQKEYYTLLK